MAYGNLTKRYVDQRPVDFYRNDYDVSAGTDIKDSPTAQLEATACLIMCNIRA